MTAAQTLPAAPPWHDHAVVAFTGQFDTHIKTGEDYGTITLAEIFTMEPGAKAKGAGPAFVPSSYHDFDAREHAAQREHGKFIAFCGDVDCGNHSLDTVRSAVEAFAGDCAWLIYSSAHARPGDMRWRIVLPLDYEFTFADWYDGQLAFFGHMEEAGIKMDHALARAGQPVYLPNVPAIHAKSDTALRSDAGPLYYQTAKTALDAPGLTKKCQPLVRRVIALRKQRAADDAERERIRREAEARRAQQPQGDNDNIIADFNASNSVATMLEICGYEQSPRSPEDWRSPKQTGDTYATRIIGEKWVSLSQSDAAARVGEQCKAGCFGDAYDLFVHYKHGGDHKAAFRALHQERRDANPNVVWGSFSASDGDPGWQEMPDWAQSEDRHHYERGGGGNAAGASEVLWPEPVDLWARHEEPPLPAGVLPDLIERFATRQAAIMGCDPAGLAMAALTVCAAAIPDGISVQVKQNDPTWQEHARLWVALVGPPSRKKTPIFKAAIAPLRRLDNELMQSYMAQVQAFEALAKTEQKGQPRPKQRRLIISDTTVEAAQEVLRDSPDGLLSEQDELSGWFGAMDKYAPGKGNQADRAFWLKSFNGGTYNLNRIGRGATQIPNLSISLLGGIQPEPIRKLAGDSVDDGLLQRLIPVVLRPSSVGQDVPNDEVVREYGELVGKLHGMEPILRKTFAGGETEVPLQFDIGARTIRERLEREHLALVEALETVSPKLASHYGKYDGIFARLCLLWHCIDNASFSTPPGLILADVAERVSRFMEDFIRPSAIAFYAGLLGMSAGHEELVSLASWIIAKRLDEVKARDAQRSSQSFRSLTGDQFRAICEKLEAFGWLERAEPGPKSITPRWLVNPRVHEAFAERAEREEQRRQAARAALQNALGG